MAQQRQLYRSRDALVGGVCGGIADYFHLDPVVTRIFAVVLVALTGGVLLIAYVVLWALLKREPEQEAPYEIEPEAVRSDTYGQVDCETARGRARDLVRPAMMSGLTAAQARFASGHVPPEPPAAVRRLMPRPESEVEERAASGDGEPARTEGEGSAAGQPAGQASEQPSFEDEIAARLASVRAAAGVSRSSVEEPAGESAGSDDAQACACAGVEESVVAAASAALFGDATGAEGDEQRGQASVVGVADGAEAGTATATGAVASDDGRAAAVADGAAASSGPAAASPAAASIPATRAIVPVKPATVPSKRAVGLGLLGASLVLFVVGSVFISGGLDGVSWWMLWPLLLIIFGLARMMVLPEPGHRMDGFVAGLAVFALGVVMLPMAMGVVSWATLGVAFVHLWPLLAVAVVLLAAGNAAHAPMVKLTAAIVFVCFCFAGLSLYALPGAMYDLSVSIPLGRELTFYTFTVASA